MVVTPVDVSALGGRPRGRFVGFGMDAIFIVAKLLLLLEPVVGGIPFSYAVSFILESICIAAMDNLGLRNDRRLDGLMLTLSLVMAIVPGPGFAGFTLPRRESRTTDSLSSRFVQFTQYHGWFGAGTHFNGGFKQKI